MHTLSTAQVSGKIDAPSGAAGSSPVHPAPPNSAPPADLAPRQSGEPPKSTTSVPTPRTVVATGDPLCGGCHRLRGLEVTGLTTVAELGAPCAVCGSVTRFRVTPEATEPQRRAIDLCACRHTEASHATTLLGVCAHRGCECRAFRPVDVAPERRAPTSHDVGQPFAVELSQDAAGHKVQVRDRAGIVAYVSLGLQSADAARWAALSWLRGQARDVGVRGLLEKQNTFEELGSLVGRILLHQTSQKHG